MAETKLRADEHIVCEHATVIEDGEGNFSGWKRNEMTNEEAYAERNEVLKAAKYIQDYCNRSSFSCARCPLHRLRPGTQQSYVCTIEQRPPFRWQLD